MTDKIKRAERTCKPIPSVLLPFWPKEIIINSPVFLTLPPKIKMLKRGDAISLNDVKFRDRRGRIRTTPRGMPFDGMSYGWFVRMITGWRNYDPETLRSAATHDCPYLCYDHLCNWPLSRKEVDVDLLDCLRCEQPRWAWVKYRAVRRIGWIPYGRKSYDPLFVQWIDRLWEGDDALNDWIARTLRAEAA